MSNKFHIYANFYLNVGRKTSSNVSNIRCSLMVSNLNLFQKPIKL